jgi:hypothetical protein
MNTELIRRLAELAGDDWDHTLESDKEFLKKFAQLIVRECIQVVGLEDSDTEEWFKAKADSVEKIKQHFGVENEY